MAETGRHRKWLWVLAVIVVLVSASLLLMDQLVTAALREVAGQVKGYRIEFSNVEVAPVRRILRIHDLEVHADAAGVDSLGKDRFDFRADQVRMDDVDLHALIVDHVLHVRLFEVDGPVMEHFFSSLRHSDADRDTADVIPQAVGGLLRLDSLVILNAQLHTQDQMAAGSQASVEDMDLSMGGLSVHVDGGLKLNIRSTRLHLAGIKAHLAPFYDLSIDHLTMERPLLRTVVAGLHLIPQVDPMDYGKHVDHQVELYRVDVDTIQLGGFGLVSYVRDGVLSADSMRIAGLLASIHRDKSLLLGEQKRKPLPSEALLALKKLLFIGMLRIDRGELRYHERSVAESPYGMIAFTDIAAVVTGISNVQGKDLPDLHLVGNCSINGQGHAELDLRMPMGPTYAPFIADVELRELPAPTLNHLTDELVHVDAVAGTIHSVMMQMNGDDRSASGVVDIRYEDLKVALNKKVEHSGLLSAAANLAIREHNMPDRPGYRTGSFSIQRNMHKSVFNYLWSGMKQGLLHVMLPGMVLKQVERSSEGGHKKKHKKH